MLDLISGRPVHGWHTCSWEEVLGRDPYHDIAIGMCQALSGVDQQYRGAKPETGWLCDWETICWSGAATPVTKLSNLARFQPCISITVLHEADVEFSLLYSLM